MDVAGAAREPRRIPRQARSARRASTALALLTSLGIHAVALLALRHRGEFAFNPPSLNLRGVEPVAESFDEPLPAAGTGAAARELLHASGTWKAVMPEAVATPLPEPQLADATDAADTQPVREPLVTPPAFALADIAQALDFRRAPHRPRVIAPAASMQEQAAQSGSVGAAESVDPPASGEAATVPAVARDVAGHVAPRALPENSPPDYPESSRHARETGRVVIHARLDETGAVRDVSVSSSSGYPELDAAALDAVRTWRFLPATLDGVAVAGEVDLPFDFVLRES